MIEKVPMTEAGYTRLQDELKRLKTVGAPLGREGARIGTRTR